MRRTDCELRTVVPSPTRRTFGITVLAAIGGALSVRTAEAFPEGSLRLFALATQILKRFGLSVSGASERGHDVLTVNALPEPEIQYDFVLNEADTFGGIVPCTKTSFFEDVTEFTHFDMNAAGGIVPCVKTTIAEPVITFEHFDADAAGGIAPCVKTTVDEPLTTFELFGAGAVSGIQPCVHVGAERLADGELGLIEVSVNEPELRFVVVIGSRTYRLVSGQLVEDIPG